MTPALADAMLSIAKGKDPPLKSETETTDDFQTRSIDWMKGELRSLRWLILILIGDAIARWMRWGGY